MDEHRLETSPLLSAAPAALSASGACELGDWRHSLLVLQGQQPGRRISLDDKPVVLGRRTAADLVLPELMVSALHCRVQVEPGRPALKVTDFKSTNGTFINGRRITGTAYLAPGSLLSVGEHVFRHEFLSPEKLVLAAYEEAQRYQTVAAWLPAAQLKGSVRTAHCYRPAQPTRGAGYALLPLAGDRHALVLIDANGPAAAVTRHAVAVLRELRDTSPSLSGPAELFGLLNARWRMDRHEGLFLTAWAAVYDPATRELRHACAGQHPALLREPGGEMRRLETLNPPLGLLADAEYVEERAALPVGARLYACNKGAFEITDRRGRLWELDDFEALLACDARHSGVDTVFQQIQGLSERPDLTDDFLLVQADFPAS